jgi:hypothetical protein
MSSQEPDPDTVQPAWFRIWREKEEKRRARHAMNDTGFKVFTVGLGAVAAGIGMTTLEGISDLSVAQVILTGAGVMVLGIVLIFLSPWAAVREEKDRAQK